MTKITPIFDKNGKKTHFFARAERAGGAAGRRPPKGARQKLARAKKNRQKIPPKTRAKTHPHKFWEFLFPHDQHRFLEFHYL